MWVIYLVSAGLELAGLLTAKRLFDIDTDGTPFFNPDALPGLRLTAALIALGVVVGGAGNILSIYS